MGQKRSAENCGGGSGSSRADGGARSSELGADKEQNVFLSRASLSSGGQGGGPASGSMHPPVQRQHLRGNVVNLAVESSGRSGNNVGGADGGLGPWRSLPLYAVLRRVSTQEAPSTATLPDEIPLSPPFKPVTFGRHRNRDVHLDCPRVPSLLSRDHAQITVDAQGTHFLEDKNTLNGTYLNGNLIPKGPCALQHGDVIAFGGPANVSLRKLFSRWIQFPMTERTREIRVFLSHSPCLVHTVSGTFLCTLTPLLFLGHLCRFCEITRRCATPSVTNIISRSPMPSGTLLRHQRGFKFIRRKLRT